MYEAVIKDIEIMKAHQHEFAQPLWIMMELSKLDLSEAELIKNADFNKAVSQMKEIAKQGYKSQFIDFTNIVMGSDF